jgi:hypothetical protein
MPRRGLNGVRDRTGHKPDPDVSRRERVRRMIGILASLFDRAQGGRRQEESPARSSAVPLAQRIRTLDTDPYLSVADADLRLISVFDDLRYDRADLDMVSPSMRRRALNRLVPLGFKQISGLMMENKAEDIRILLPKFHALGASPFDATRHTSRRAQDYFILTPTQTACQIIDAYPLDEAVDRIKALIVKHPINLYRLFDYLERKPEHQAFKGAIGHLKFVQREAVEKEPLKSRRALRW